PKVTGYRLPACNGLNRLFLDVALHGIDGRVGGDDPPCRTAVARRQRLDRLGNLPLGQPTHLRDCPRQLLEASVRDFCAVCVTNPSQRGHMTRQVLLSWVDVRAMTMKSRTQSRRRFQRPAATHDLLIHFVRRADRLQYYDCAALCSTGRSLRELSTALKICW